MTKAIHSDDLRPWIVRHRPQADHVYPHDYCKLCGDVGYYFCISKTDPENVWEKPCENPSCMPNRFDRGDVTLEIALDLEPEDGPRGERYGDSELVSANSLSGTFDTTA